MRYLLLFGLYICQPLVAPDSPMPRGGPKLIVVNDDGFSRFHSGHYRTKEDLRREMLSYRDTQVAVIEWCVISGSRSNYPSNVTEMIGSGMTDFPRRGDKLASETLHQMAKDGVNSLQVVADACHQSGIACYASLRMNGDYSPDAWGGSLARYSNSTFWWDHPEFRQRDADGKLLTKFSFAFAEVREFRLAILREVVLQDIDGITLDFQRHPEFFGFEQPMAKAFKETYGIESASVPSTDPRWIPLRCGFMTSFVRDVRKLLDHAGMLKGRHLGLSVRIDWQKYPLWGCDIGTWLKDGMLDYLVVGQHGLGGYEFDITPFVKLASGRGCAVLFGEEATLKGHDRTAEEDRLIAAGRLKPRPSTLLSREQYVARAARWYAAGADGLHLFNESRRAVMSGLGSVTPNGTHP